MTTLVPLASAQHQAPTQDWIALTPVGSFDAWRVPTGQWAYVSEVALSPNNPRRLSGSDSPGPVLYNGASGRTGNLVTKDNFGDLELHAEFLVPKGSNSGIKFNGHYEIQIADSFGKEKPNARDCGGIYPRAELLPTYHHIDDGIPALVNAEKAPGEWQTLEIAFRAPRFDAEGRKTANARFVKVTLNGTVIHHDVELLYPTGHAWRRPEVATGPILLQGDHGPVAFRNVRIRKLAQDDHSAHSHPAGINEPFISKQLNVKEFIARFEAENREVFRKRAEIADYCDIDAGMSVADVGAGTGIYTLLFADRVGPRGTVHAVDIAEPFLAHIAAEAKRLNHANIKIYLGGDTSTNLPAESCDVIFVCDTYHHFEKPAEMLASIRSALRPGGRLVIVEFDKHDKASEFIRKHLRATRAEIVGEIKAAGFDEITPAGAPKLEENFIAVFRKAAAAPAATRP